MQLPENKNVMSEGGVVKMERDEKIVVTVYGIIVLIFTVGTIVGAHFLQNFGL